MWLLTCCILSPPHANVERERGFSINNHLLVIHGYSLKEETLQALRLIRGDIIENDVICNDNVTKEMMKFFWKCKESLQCILTEAKVTRKLSKADIEAKIVQVELKESDDVLNQDEKLREIMRSKTIDLEELLLVERGKLEFHQI